MVDNIRDRAGDEFDRARDKADEHVDNARNRAQKGVDDLRDKTQSQGKDADRGGMADKMKDKAKDFTDR